MKKSLLFFALILSYVLSMAQVTVSSSYFKDDMSTTLTGASYVLGGSLEFMSVVRSSTGVVATYDSLTSSTSGAVVGVADLTNNVTLKLEAPMNLVDSLTRFVKITGTSSQSQKLYVLFWNGANTWDIWTNKSGYGTADLPAGSFDLTIYVPDNDAKDFNFAATSKLAFALNLWGWNDIAKVGTPAIVGPGTLELKSVEFGIPAVGLVEKAVAGIDVYPTKDVANTITVKNAASVSIYNESGILVSSASNLGNVAEINVAGLISGIYFVKADNAVVKIIKK